MHNRKLNNPSLQRLYQALKSGDEMSTRTLHQRTGIEAIGTAVSELRKHGKQITCRIQMRNGQRIFVYQMEREAA